MGKTAKKSSKREKTIDDYMQDQADAAKKLFIGSTMNLSFRLAITVLIPLVGGIKIDQRYDSAPSFTLAGIVLAISFGTAAVMSTVKEVNELQAEESKKGKK